MDIKSDWYIENSCHSVMFLIEGNCSHRFGKEPPVNDTINDVIQKSSRCSSRKQRQEKPSNLSFLVSQ